MLEIIFPSLFRARSEESYIENAGYIQMFHSSMGGVFPCTCL